MEARNNINSESTTNLYLAERTSSPLPFTAFTEKNYPSLYWSSGDLSPDVTTASDNSISSYVQMTNSTTNNTIAGYDCMDLVGSINGRTNSITVLNSDLQETAEPQYLHIAPSADGVDDYVSSLYPSSGGFTRLNEKHEHMNQGGLWNDENVTYHQSEHLASLYSQTQRSMSFSDGSVQHGHQALLDPNFNATLASFPAYNALHNGGCLNQQSMPILFPMAIPPDHFPKYANNATVGEIPGNGPFESTTAIRSQFSSAISDYEFEKPRSHSLKTYFEETKVGTLKSHRANLTDETNGNASKLESMAFNMGIATPPTSKSTEKDPSALEKLESPGRTRLRTQSVSAKGRASKTQSFKYVKQAQLSKQSNVIKQQLENEVQWLPISGFSDERKRSITAILRKKGVSVDTADEVFDSFHQNFISKKLEILATEFGSYYADFHNTQQELQFLDEKDISGLSSCLWLAQQNERTENQLKQFPRCVIKNKWNDRGSFQLDIQVRTSSGYNDFTHEVLSDDDLNVMKLRHMPLLRESEDRRRKSRYYQFIDNKMKRPLNSFMIYRSVLIKALSLLRVLSIVSSLVSTTMKEYSELSEEECIDKILNVVYQRNGKPLIQESMVSHNEFKRVSALIDNHLYIVPTNKLNLEIGNVEKYPIEPLFSNNTVLSYVVTEMWKTESEDVKNHFVAFSKIEKNHHNQVYPKYKFSPVKKFNLENEFEDDKAADEDL